MMNFKFITKYWALCILEADDTSNQFQFHYFFQDEVADLKASKDVSHSTLEDLDTEDLYVKLKVGKPFPISS